MTSAQIKLVGGLVYGLGSLLVAASLSEAPAQRRSLSFFVFFLAVNLLINLVFASKSASRVAITAPHLVAIGALVGALASSAVWKPARARRSE